MNFEKLNFLEEFYRLDNECYFKYAIEKFKINK